MKCQSLNKIYEQDELFYWCNCCGDINMPGESGHFVTHKPEDLPPRYFALYDKCQMETDGCHRHVVSFCGKPGMMLVALHDKCYYCDILEMAERPSNPTEVVEHECMMKMVALLITRRCEAMSADPRLEHCIPIFGENTDPDGHELCLFIPAATAMGSIDEIQDAFLEYCWTEADKDLLTQSFKVLRENS